MSLSSYIFGTTEEKKKMPSLSSKDIQQTDSLPSAVKKEDEPVVEKKVTLFDLFKLPENKGSEIWIEDESGFWIISNNGVNLSRVHNKAAVFPRIDSYFSVYDSTGEASYFMTSGHTFAMKYYNEKIRLRCFCPNGAIGGEISVIFKNFEWKKT